MRYLRVFLLLAVGLTSVAAQFNEIDILPPIDRNRDCSSSQSREDQLRLFWKFRGLYDFRRYHYSESRDDFFNRSGSVVFLDQQEEVLHLKCPCKEEDVEAWKQFGKGLESTMFNEAWGETKVRGNELNVKRPDPRSYYRTIGCFAKGNKYHYFNIFTRPGVQTDFPVYFMEGSKDNLFWRCYIRKNSKENCLQGPYSFAWVLPNTSSKVVRVLQEPGLDASTDVLFGNRTEPNNLMSEIDCYMTQIGGAACVKPRVTAFVRAEILGPANHAKQAGDYECVVTDRHGLSSSFRFSNLDGSETEMKRIGEMKFGGLVHVHIRIFWYVFVPIGLIALIFLLTTLCVWVLPDNKEEQIEQLREQEEMRRIERQRLSNPVEDQPPMTNPSRTTSPGAAKAPDETESMMHQMAGSSAALKRGSKKTIHSKVDEPPGQEEHEGPTHSDSPHHPHHKKKKKHPHPAHPQSQ